MRIAYPYTACFGAGSAAPARRHQRANIGHAPERPFMFVCGCGHVLKTNIDPIPGYGRLLTSAAVVGFMDAAQDRIVEDAERTAAAGLGMREVPEGELTSFANRVNDALHEEFLERSRRVVDCPACGNLYVSNGPGPRDYKRYREAESDLRAGDA